VTNTTQSHRPPLMIYDIENPQCLRVERSRERGDKIQQELSVEYSHCFRHIECIDGCRWRDCIRRCAPTAVWVALSATMPMLENSTCDAVRVMNRVILAVINVFLAYLRRTWYGIENAQLERLCCAVSRLLTHHDLVGVNRHA